MKSLEHFDFKSWDISMPEKVQNRAVDALEKGNILYFPSLSFNLNAEEKCFLSAEKLSPKSKNINYDAKTDVLGGSLYVGQEEKRLKEMMGRYALYSSQFLKRLTPRYEMHLIQARTSFRPSEIFGRKSSYRKDDTLLHVDAFPATPTRGKRILRFFTNINPDGKPRVWRVGEPFLQVVEKMGPRISQPIFGTALLLKLLKITKDKRSLYDHYMLQMHNRMKADGKYQKNVSFEEIQFPAGSSWILYTDQVSHAALSGQHVLEQTFYLPVNGLKDPSSSPLKMLEKALMKNLV